MIRWIAHQLRIWRFDRAERHTRKAFQKMRLKEPSVAALARKPTDGDNQGKCLIAAPRQSTLTLSDNQAAAKKPCGPQ
jgi:hypothetical protein